MFKLLLRQRLRLTTLTEQWVHLRSVCCHSNRFTKILKNWFYNVENFCCFNLIVVGKFTDDSTKIQNIMVPLFLPLSTFLELHVKCDEVEKRSEKMYLELMKDNRWIDKSRCI